MILYSNYSSPIENTYSKSYAILVPFLKTNQVQFVLLISRQGKVWLAKWYTPMSPKESSKAVRDVCSMVIGRPSKLCNFLEWKDYKLIWKRYVV